VYAPTVQIENSGTSRDVGTTARHGLGRIVTACVGWVLGRWGKVRNCTTGNLKKIVIIYCWELDLEYGGIAVKFLYVCKSRNVFSARRFEV
jgi:hypothetical protein